MHGKAWVNPSDFQITHLDSIVNRKDDAPDRRLCRRFASRREDGRESQSSVNGGGNFVRKTPDMVYLPVHTVGAFP